MTAKSGKRHGYSVDPALEYIGNRTKMDCSECSILRPLNEPTSTTGAFFKASCRYVSNIFTFENDSSDPDTPKPEKIKKFWSFVKSLKEDACGIASLRENGILKTDTKEKANICNRQFQSAFTRLKGLVRSPPWGT